MWLNLKWLYFLRSGRYHTYMRVFCLDLFVNCVSSIARMVSTCTMYNFHELLVILRVWMLYLICICIFLYVVVPTLLALNCNLIINFNYNKIHIFYRNLVMIHLPISLILILFHMYGVPNLLSHNHVKQRIKRKL